MCILFIIDTRLNVNEIKNKEKTGGLSDYYFFTRFLSDDELLFVLKMFFSKTIAL